VPAAVTATEQQPPSPQQVQSEKPRKKGYKGRITAIDLAAGTITVRRSSTMKTFTVGADVPIRTLHKPKATLADLQRGDWVNVRFVAQGSTNIATRINHASEMMPIDDLEPATTSTSR
jgi:Cu/Ag efflux protein CusF